MMRINIERVEVFDERFYSYVTELKNLASRVDSLEKKIAKDSLGKTATTEIKKSLKTIHKRIEDEKFYLNDLASALEKTTIKYRNIEADIVGNLTQGNKDYYADVSKKNNSVDAAAAKERTKDKYKKSLVKDEYTCEGFSVPNSVKNFVCSKEGLLLKSTWKDGGWDIGYGMHISFYDGKKKVDVTKNMTITKEEAEKYFITNFIHKGMEPAISYLKKYKFDLSKMTDNQVGALASYVYNRGSHAEELFRNSKTIEDLGNNLPVYWGSNEGVKKGLVKRRKEEKKIFFTPDK